MAIERVKIQEIYVPERTRKEKIFYKLYDELYEDNLFSFTNYFYINDRFVFKKDMITYVLENYSQKEIGEYITKYIDPEFMESLKVEVETPTYSIQTKEESHTKNICPNCKKEIDSSEKFCIFCGAKIEITYICPNCKKDIFSTDNFCSHCRKELIKEEVELFTENQRKIEYENQLKSVYKKMIEGTLIQAPYDKIEIKSKTELRTITQPAHTITEHHGDYSYSTHYPSQIYTKEVEVKERKKIPSYKIYKAYFNKDMMVLSGKQRFKEIFYDDVAELEYPKKDGNEEVTIILKNNEKIHLKLYPKDYPFTNDINLVFYAFIKTFVEQGNNLPDEYFKLEEN